MGFIPQQIEKTPLEKGILLLINNGESSSY